MMENQTWLLINVTMDSHSAVSINIPTMKKTLRQTVELNNMETKRTTNGVTKRASEGSILAPKRKPAAMTPRGIQISPNVIITIENDKIRYTRVENRTDFARTVSCFSTKSPIDRF